MPAAEPIDVRALVAKYSVEELCESADEYFRRLDNWDYLLAKPLAQVDEAPELLQCFAHVVQGLLLAPGMTVLDFGAGACWTSRFLSQLGMEVVALDVSESALRIGAALYRRNPVVGDQPEPRFVRFDGHRIPLADASVDRISCWEAFHHVPNPAQVLQEMARVLKPGGIAGFSEPGPTHSQAPQSQAEMRNHRVIECDIVLEDIWKQARSVGFGDIRVALYSARAPLLGLQEFLGFASGRDERALQRIAAELKGYLPGRRLFFLYREGAAEASDSRRREGLAGRLEVTLAAGTTPGCLLAKAVVRNTGSAAWLGRSARVGAVHLGVHLYDPAMKLVGHGYHVHYGLGGDDPDATILPGQRRAFEFELPVPAPGRYVFEFDLVASGVAWFAHCGATPARIPWTVPERPTPG